MPGFDNYTQAAITAVLAAHRHAITGSDGSGGGGGPPVGIDAIGFQWNASRGVYELIDPNTETPDAFYVVSGDDVVLDDGVSDGLTIEKVGDDYLVENP